MRPATATSDRGSPASAITQVGSGVWLPLWVHALRQASSSELAASSSSELAARGSSELAASSNGEQQQVQLELPFASGFRRQPAAVAHVLPVAWRSLRPRSRAPPPPDLQV